MADEKNMKLSEDQLKDATGGAGLIAPNGAGHAVAPRTATDPIMGGMGGGHASAPYKAADPLIGGGQAVAPKQQNTATDVMAAHR